MLRPYAMQQLGYVYWTREVNTPYDEKGYTGDDIPTHALLTASSGTMAGSTWR